MALDLENTVKGLLDISLSARMADDTLAADVKGRMTIIEG